MHFGKKFRVVSNMQRDMLTVQRMICHGSGAFQRLKPEDLRIHSVRIAAYMRVTYIRCIMVQIHLNSLLDDIRINDRTVASNFDNDVCPNGLRRTNNTHHYVLFTAAIGSNALLGCELNQDVVGCIDGCCEHYLVNRRHHPQSIEQMAKHRLPEGPQKHLAR